MSNKKDIQEMLVSMGFPVNYIQRAFKVYEKNYGSSYNVEVITEIIVRLQNKDNAKQHKGGGGKEKSPQPPKDAKAASASSSSSNKPSPSKGKANDSAKKKEPQRSVPPNNGNKRGGTGSKHSNNGQQKPLPTASNNKNNGNMPMSSMNRASSNPNKKKNPPKTPPPSHAPPNASSPYSHTHQQPASKVHQKSQSQMSNSYGQQHQSAQRGSPQPPARFQPKEIVLYQGNIEAEVMRIIDAKHVEITYPVQAYIMQRQKTVVDPVTLQKKASNKPSRHASQNSGSNTRIPFKYAYAARPIDSVDAEIREVGAMDAENQANPFLQQRSNRIRKRKEMDSDHLDEGTFISTAPCRKKQRIDTECNTNALAQDERTGIVARWSQQKQLILTATSVMDGVIQETEDKLDETVQERDGLRSRLKSSLWEVDELKTVIANIQTRSEKERQSMKQEIEELKAKNTELTAMKATVHSSWEEQRQRTMEQRKQHKKEQAKYVKKIEELNARITKLKAYDVENLHGLTEDELDALELKFLQNMKKIKEARNKVMEDQLYCIVCKEKKKNVVLGPCNHLDLCDACERAMERKVCPRCNERYGSVINLKI